MGKDETAKEKIRMSLKKIRDDLMNIRYYHARKEKFDSALKEAGQNPYIEKARKYYNALLSEADKLPARLLELFILLYTQNFTQEAAANEMGFTPQHVQRLNKQLLLFFQSKFSEEGGNDNV